MQRRCCLVHGRYDLLVLVRAGDSKDAGIGITNTLLLHTETTRDDDAPVLGHRLADSLKAFLFGGVEEAAGVDDDDIGARVVG